MASRTLAITVLAFDTGKNMQLSKLVSSLFIVSLGTIGCSGDALDTVESPEFDVNGEAVINGYGWSWQGDRPYEKMFVKVSNLTTGTYCSGTLIGGPSTAKHVLTAAHCIDSVNDDVVIRRMEGKTAYIERTSVKIRKAPARSNGDYVDAALIELDSSISVPGSVYFTNSDGQELIGTKVRCYGFGATGWDGDSWTGGGALKWADFYVKDNNGSSTYYELTVPNSANQALGPGDSGGSCFHSPEKVENEQRYYFTITGVHKAGNTSLGEAGSVPTYNRQTSAVWFSNWVRQYVPRPDETH